MKTFLDWMFKAKKGEDMRARLYLRRIEAFRQTPPAADWDAGSTLDTK